MHKAAAAASKGSAPSEAQLCESCVVRKSCVRSSQQIAIQSRKGKAIVPNAIGGSCISSKTHSKRRANLGQSRRPKAATNRDSRVQPATTVSQSVSWLCKSNSKSESERREQSNNLVAAENRPHVIVVGLFAGQAAFASESRRVNERANRRPNCPFAHTNTASTETEAKVSASCCAAAAAGLCASPKSSGCVGAVVAVCEN